VDVRRLGLVLASALMVGGCLPLDGGSGNSGGGIFGDPFGGGQSSSYRGNSRVSCDQRTQVCYKDGEIDASETKDTFGKGAARRVDRVRDDAGTNNIFLPRNNTVCNRDEKVCYKNGRPDQSDTRDQFGKKAARKIQAN
jgi:hypothetical protein